jgi:hypothetical protein
MTRRLLVLLALAGCKDIVVPLSNGPDAGMPDGDDGTGTSAEEAMGDWPESAKGAARALIQRYGQPDETTTVALTWESRGPWKRTIVHRDEIKHAFPRPHVDVVEQVLDLKIPADKVGALAQFDGSVVVWRTRGEVSAWGPDEPSNFGLLNLTMDLVSGAKTPDEARRAYTDAIAQAAAGQSPPILQRLQSTPPTGDQGDPDFAVPPPI